MEILQFRINFELLLFSIQAFRNKTGVVGEKSRFAF